jgi:hypothetical protein
MLKQIALVLAASGLLVSSAMACPNSDHDKAQAPKTAQKDKAPAQKAPAKKAPAKKTETKPRDTVAKK